MRARASLVPSSLRKICQLTGELDRGRGTPAFNRTETNFGCSPAPNPDERVSGDLKRAFVREEPARGKAHLERAVVGRMRKLSKSPQRVRSFFGHGTIRYAA